VDVDLFINVISHDAGLSVRVLPAFQ